MINIYRQHDRSYDPASTQHRITVGNKKTTPTCGPFYAPPSVVSPSTCKRSIRPQISALPSQSHHNSRAALSLHPRAPPAPSQAGPRRRAPPSRGTRESPPLLIVSSCLARRMGRTRRRSTRPSSLRAYDMSICERFIRFATMVVRCFLPPITLFPIAQPRSATSPLRPHPHPRAAATASLPSRRAPSLG